MRDDLAEKKVKRLGLRANGVNLNKNLNLWVHIIHIIILSFDCITLGT